MKCPFKVTGFIKGINGGECTDDYFETYERAKEFFDGAKKAQKENPKRKWIADNLQKLVGSDWITIA